ncbi:hypothetical protein CONCODRAFT_15028 [Conidiobolus coronatus NRRL 28638]|uniref:ATP synthase subunit 4 n=1 Tax=Conidiobolus coronatus (strain ATCC 28846 / CBS 209.66 / NRRL 28638) TaxID=796925 RepID=A0A137PGM9_CONC2|nr:hypothetical protein CONCODRAFT_15028 [Conidiobolus coronatus NRRL 28638]|eukprot:KXN74154.1 hypothetical protein CONCODRAFT_15028 [Conidiobolus coronatus NRRL 28638]
MSSYLAKSVLRASRSANTYKLSAINGARFLSSEKQTTPKTSEAPADEHHAKALSFIDSLPSNDIVSKTGLLTIGATAATWLVSKEIYVINEESLVLASFAFVISYIYKTIREPYSEWADARLKDITQILTDARTEHKTQVQHRIEEASQLSDIVPITKDLFAMSKEIAETQAKAFELKQRVAVAAEVKSVLDSWVRYENSLREREQRELAAKVIANIEASLKDPKLQNQILKEAIQEVQRLTKN